jgi:hypothetical protein
MYVSTAASYMLFLASISSGQTSTVYGMGESFCGDTHAPTSCSVGAITATGDAFDPAKLTAAIPLPANRRLRKGFYVYLRHGDEGPCVPILVNDKKNAKYRGLHSFDLTPASVHALTGKYPTKYWSSKGVSICHFIPSFVPIVKVSSNNYVSQLIQSTLSIAPFAIPTLFAVQ